MDKIIPCQISYLCLLFLKLNHQPYCKGTVLHAAHGPHFAYHYSTTLGRQMVRPSPTTRTQLSGESVSLLKPDQLTSEIKKKRIKIPTQCISNTKKKCSIFSMPAYLDASQRRGTTRALPN